MRVVKANHKNAVKTNRPRSQPVQVSSDSVKFAKLAHYIKDVFCRHETHQPASYHPGKQGRVMAHRTSGGRRHGRRSSISSGAATTLPTTSSTKCATKAGSNGRRPGERRISACAAGARGRTPPAPAAALIGLERPII